MSTQEQKVKAIRENHDSMRPTPIELIVLMVTAVFLLRLVVLIFTGPFFWVNALLALLLVACFAESFRTKDRMVMWLTILFISIVLTPVLQRAKRIDERLKARHHVR